MTDREKDLQYEQLYTQLLSRGETLHENNKKRIKHGVILLLLLPFILGFIIWITDSNKIVFLILWIICMFAISVYLISVEYLDDSIKKTLEEVTERESGLDRLLPKASGRDLQDRIRDRLTERRIMRVAEEEARIRKASEKIAAEIEQTEQIPDAENAQEKEDEQ